MFAVMQDYSARLSKYMPAAAAPVIARWIADSGCQFRISRSRATKLGDYRPPFNSRGHRISVNHNLNPYAFLITTVHEFAHLATWERHRNRVRPHGPEWKMHFKRLMLPFLDGQIFPLDVDAALRRHINNPSAASCTDRKLMTVLRRYNQVTEGLHTVESLSDGALFKLKNGRVFRKLAKLRVRHRCIELKTRRLYLFHPLAEVMPVTPEPAATPTGSPT